MHEIRMVDLQTQYLRIKPEIDEAIQRVVEETHYIKGPEVERFEKALSVYCDVKHAITCANGTDALQIALMALDLKPGDEVITSPFTFIATAEVIALLGLKVVFVDANPNTFNIDASKIEAAISSRTKAIIPVHLFGQSADMEEIINIAERHKLYIIEDAAQAIGTEFKFSTGMIKQCGTMGHIGCTSFFPSKNLGAMGDAGALFTNDDALAKKMKSIANHGSEVKYYHKHIGINSRTDTLQAAVLNVKLKYLNEYIAARQSAADAYHSLLRNCEGIVLPYLDKNSTHSYHQFTLLVKNNKRDELKNHLAKHNIPSMIYYPQPLHLQEAYAYFGYSAGDFPVSEALSGEVLSLPMHTELTEAQIEYIASQIHSFYH